LAAQQPQQIHPLTIMLQQGIHNNEAKIKFMLDNEGLREVSVTKSHIVVAHWAELLIWPGLSAIGGSQRPRAAGKLYYCKVPVSSRRRTKQSLCGWRSGCQR